MLDPLLGNSPRQEQNVNIFTVCLNQADMKCTTLLGIFCLSTVLVSRSVGLSPRIPGRRNKEPEGRYTRNIKDY
jgi:hypothetical protein